jgi:hypothetical protein
VANGGLEIRFVATLTDAHGSPVLMELEDGRAWWRPPVALGAAVPLAALDFTACASATSVDLVMRRRSTSETVLLPGRTEPLARGDAGSLPVGAARTVRIDPGTIDHGAPMRLGEWELDVQIASCGWRVRGLLTGFAGAGPRGPERAVVTFRARRGEARLVAVPPTKGPWRLKARRSRTKQPDAEPAPSNTVVGWVRLGTRRWRRLTRASGLYRRGARRRS